MFSEGNINHAGDVCLIVFKKKIGKPEPAWGSAGVSHSRFGSDGKPSVFSCPQSSSWFWVLGFVDGVLVGTDLLAGRGGGAGGVL